MTTPFAAYNVCELVTKFTHFNDYIALKLVNRRFHELVMLEYVVTARSLPYSRFSLQNIEWVRFADVTKLLGNIIIDYTKVMNLFRVVNDANCAAYYATAYYVLKHQVSHYGPTFLESFRAFVRYCGNNLTNYRVNELIEAPYSDAISCELYITAESALERRTYLAFKNRMIEKITSQKSRKMTRAFFSQGVAQHIARMSTNIGKSYEMPRLYTSREVDIILASSSVVNMFMTPLMITVNVANLGSVTMPISCLMTVEEMFIHVMNDEIRCFLIEFYEKALELAYE